MGCGLRTYPGPRQERHAQAQCRGGDGRRHDRAVRPCRAGWGQITAGSGTVHQDGSVTTINQSSQNLSLDWQSFNTGASETVNFSQPSTSAIAVNRIADQNPTQFLGKLNANGQVYLINPNGVIFGSGAQVNVGGLVASTLDINDSAAAGNSRTFSGTGAGSVVNKGTINTANGGYVAFVGKHVENQGTITTPGGAAALAAGSDVTLSFTGDKLVNLQINKSTVDTLAENGGLVQADGGAVWMSAGARDTVLASVVNNTGIVQARSVQNVNGAIVLEAGSAGITTNDGTLDVAGAAAGQHGGSAKVLGGAVELAANSRIEASGDTGGGSVLVGGNFKGLGPQQRAATTRVAAGSRIEANARSRGNGGQVAVWSDGTTRFDGQISARGGSAGGNGGSVETSGKHLTIGSSSSVATLAPHGQTGEWLLDPNDFTIYSDGFSTGDMKDTDVTAALQSSNLTIKTGASTTCTAGLSCTGHSGNGDIILANGTLVGGSNWTSGTTLTLSAYRNIELQGTSNLDAASGTGSIALRSDNTGTGTGTVILDTQSNIFGNTTGTVKIYYNPSSYSSPTDYAGMTDASGDLLIRMPDASLLSTYMYINLAAVIGNKTYDGNTTASISSAAVRGGAPSDVMIDTSGATAAFADKNVGTGKAVTVSGVTLSGPGASKYAINGLDSSSATISKRDLSLSGISASNKTYDGTVNATMTGSAAVSALGGDAVAVAGSGAGSTFADKNAGTGKAVTVSGYTLAGADAGNYNLIAPTGLTADIAKANLNVTGVSALSRTYDGTTNAALAGTAAVAAFGGDVVNVTGTGSATFADKNAGSGKAVTVTGYGLSGADAGNYNVVQPTGLSATINKASLSVAGVSVADKTYDGTTSATLTGTAAVSGIGGDDVSVNGSGSATFNNKNAGINKAVNISGYSLAGLDAGNYTLNSSPGLSATISKLDLALFGISASNKTYDGTVNATMER
ncbi:YDG domain-containing protein [Pseudomonas sp. KNUC1026]|uniref:YDG domain-containing protein n=1 Tax=Pseudomonas sp. KNUC1026 TaxID=2893890 RepID=UPI003FA73C78